MRLSSLADYAVVMMTAVARQCGSRGGGGLARLNATLLSAETGVPLPTVQKLVSRLSGAGLIESTRGTGGGFRLSRPPSAISLADIIEAIEGPIALTTCVDAARHDCAIDGNCRVKPHWRAVNDAVRGALAGISLASLSAFPGEGTPRKVLLSEDPEGRGPVVERELADDSVLLREPSRLDPGLRRGTAEVVN